LIFKSVLPEDGPSWVEVLLELLLELLSHPKGFFRSIVNLVFEMLLPHMTQKSLQLILDVRKPCITLFAL
jgi:hypothetical protein